MALKIPIGYCNSIFKNLKFYIFPFGWGSGSTWLLKETFEPRLLKKDSQREFLTA